MRKTHWCYGRFAKYSQKTSKFSWKCQVQFEFAEAIKQFSDGPTEEIDGNNRNLKCYMNCLIHESENYNGTRGINELNFFTPEDYAYLFQMVLNCQHLFDGQTDHCEMAFRIYSCMKMANPEVNSYSPRYTIEAIGISISFSITF